MALSWDLVAAPSESQGIAICYSPDLDRWVAMGEIVMFSDDGINWSAGTAPDYHAVTNYVAKNGIIWNAVLNLFIAVCRDNNFVNDTHILTSPDGETWTTRTGDGVPLLNHVAYEPVTGFTVIVADNGGCLTSVNGTVWTAAGNDLVGLGATNDWKCIVWNSFGSIFVTLGSAGDIPIATSTDGLTWTGRHGFEPTKQSGWVSVAFNPSNGHMLVVSGANGRFAMRSDDGITWEDKYTITGVPVFTAQCYIVIWSAIVSAFLAIIDDDVAEEGQVWINATGEQADWSIDSLIPDTVVSSGSAWEWQALAENSVEERLVAGHHNPSNEPFATALNNAVTITGDAEIGIEDHSFIASPTEMIGTAEIGILASNANEIIGNAVLGIEGNPRTVFSADASGLYVLVPGKTDDTIYLREAEDDATVETLDIAIPDPTIGTSYVGG